MTRFRVRCAPSSRQRSPIEECVHCAGQSRKPRSAIGMLLVGCPGLFGLPLALGHRWYRRVVGRNISRRHRAAIGAPATATVCIVRCNCQRKPLFCSAQSGYGQNYVSLDAHRVGGRWNRRRRRLDRVGRRPRPRNRGCSLVRAEAPQRSRPILVVGEGVRSRAIAQRDRYHTRLAFDGGTRNR